ncbi:cell wall-binding repeat-containing protein [Metabacillus halosaccharovorans]|uniref:cell wall-binding repeat-containing protein n=1 Tax=Metabacillus halosaccharovorans TaxID=930124 RepID=UPI0034D0051D
MKKLCQFAIICFVLLFTLSSVSAGSAPERLSGKDRFEVAVNISKKGWTTSKTVIIANNNAFADALAASPLAFQKDAPILLTHGDTLTQATKREIQRLKPSNAIIIGGPKSVSEKVINDIKKLNISDVVRIGGKDRFEVSYNIAKILGNTNTAIIAYGYNFADALAISPYASKNGFPILLTDTKKLPSVTKQALSEKGIKKTIVVGGEKSVSTTVYNQLPGKQRIGGKDRYEVAANIIHTLKLPTRKAYLATGLTFADALTGSVLAAKHNAPLLLTNPKKAPDSIKTIIKSKNITNITILGGPVSVPDQNYLELTGAMPLAGKKIILDAGHGGSDPGAVRGSVYEKNLNIDFTKKLATKLSSKGATILYTRDPKNDKFISLEDRAKIANNSQADLFISIHHDANVSSSENGLSVHYSTYRPAIETKDVYVTYNGKNYSFVRENTSQRTFSIKYGSGIKNVSYEGNVIAYDPTPSHAAVQSKNLAPRVAAALTSHGIKSDGTRDHNLYVTRWTNMTSLLIELGFMSNSKELSTLKNSTVQDQRAQAMANSIEEFFK